MPANKAHLSLSLKALKYFVVTAEAGSLTRAALSLGIAQSALSRQISNLEQLTNNRVFFRTGRGIVLTEHGERLLPHAIHVLETSRNFLEYANNLEGQPEGMVKVGVIPGISALLFGKLLKQVRTYYPKIILHAIEEHSGEIELMLSKGLIDVGFYNRYRTIKNPMKQALRTKNMVLVGRSESPAMAKQEIRFCELGELELVMPPHPKNLRAVFEEEANALQIPMNIVLEASPGAIMRGVLLDNDVYTILPTHALMDPYLTGRVRGIPLIDPPLQQTLYMETTRQHPTSAATKIVLHLIKKIITAESLL